MARSSLLVVEWSPSRVRVFDPTTGRSTYGATLAEVVGETHKGREAVIGISRRSAFVRTTYVPNASRSEIDGILRVQLEGVLPFAPNEYVLGLRLGQFVPGKGRLAAVGAIKTESLQRISNEAKACGLRVRSVLPIAYGSWLAARAHSLTDCAVVEAHEDGLNIDLIKDGELHYSRSAPVPESREDIEDEITRTFAAAEVPRMAVLSAATPEIDADVRDAAGTLERLADPVALARLFSFELPSKTEAKLTRTAKWKARRAIAAAAVAIGLGGYAYSVRTRNLPKPDPKAGALVASLQKTRKAKMEAEDRLARVDRAGRILDVAFRPAQTMGDVVTVLASAAVEGSWFTTLNVGRGIPITVAGLAKNDRDVTAFLGAVSRDPRFQGMKVVSTNKTAIGDIPLTQFFVTGNAVGTLPFDRPLKEKRKVGKSQP